MNTYLGKSCLRGHDGLRYKCNGYCVTCQRLKSAQWYKENIERSLEMGRKYVENNRENVRRSKQKWKIKNPHAVRMSKRATEATRRARKLKNGGHYTTAQIENLIGKQKNKCAACRSRLKVYEIDHIIPLSRGGNNYISNIQILCVSCNRRKNARDNIDFMRMNGYLL